MRPLLIMGWLELMALSVLDLFVSAGRHEPWRVCGLAIVIVLLWILRDTITNPHPEEE